MLAVPEVGVGACLRISWSKKTKGVAVFAWGSRAPPPGKSDGKMAGKTFPRSEKDPEAIIFLLYWDDACRTVCLFCVCWDQHPAV